MRDLVARATLVALVAYSAVSTDLYLSGIPAIVQELGVGHADGQLTLSLFMLGFAGGQLLFGPLSDYYGRKPVVAAGLCIYVVASAMCAMAPSIEVLWAARMLQGFAAASGPVIARAIVRDRYEARQAAQMMSLLAGAMAMVPLVAPVLGSWLLYWFSWRAQFVLLILFGLVTLVGLRSLRESAPSIGLGPLHVAGVLGQFRRCLGSRAFVGFVLCGGAAFAASFAYISSASFIVIELLGVAPQNFGYTFMLAVSGYMSGSFLGSFLVQRAGIRHTLLCGVCTAVCGTAVLCSLALWQVYSLAGLILAIFLCFVGAGLCLANAQMGAISEFPLAAGGASAVFGFVQTVMASLSGYVVGQTYDGTLMPTAMTMTAAMLLSVIGYLVLRTAPDAAAALKSESGP